MTYSGPVPKVSSGLTSLSSVSCARLRHMSRPAGHFYRFSFYFYRFSFYRFSLAAALLCLAGDTGWAGIINSNAVDASLFDVSTFASGIAFPAGVQPLSDGSVLVQSSPDYGTTPAQVLSFTSTGGGNSVYSSPVLGLMEGSAQVGNYYAVGNFGGVIGPNGDISISLLQPGVTGSDPLTEVAKLNFNFPGGGNWDHDQMAMAARPTPGVAGSWDMIVNVGSEYDNVATPAGDQVTLTGAGFASMPSVSLSGDSLYMITINENGPQPAITAVTQVATGTRNVFGMTFDDLGNLWFSDNGMHYPPGAASLSRHRENRHRRTNWMSLPATSWAWVPRRTMASPTATSNTPGATFPACRWEAAACSPSLRFNRLQTQTGFIS